MTSAEIGLQGKASTKGCVAPDTAQEVLQDFLRYLAELRAPFEVCALRGLHSPLRVLLGLLAYEHPGSEVNASGEAMVQPTAPCLCQLQQASFPTSWVGESLKDLQLPREAREEFGDDFDVSTITSSPTHDAFLQVSTPHPVASTPVMHLSSIYYSHHRSEGTAASLERCRAATTPKADHPKAPTSRMRRRSAKTSEESPRSERRRCSTRSRPKKAAS